MWPWALSAGVHLAAVAAMPVEWSAPAARRAHADTDVLALSVVIEGRSTETVSSEAAVARSSDGAFPVAVPQPTHTAHTAHTARTTQTVPTEPPPPPVAPAEAPASPMVDPAPREERVPITPIDPEHVARSWQALDVITPEGEARRAERAIEERLDAELRARAMTKGYVSHRRVELVPRRDGSYVHQGDGFTAVIRPDGSVQFGDRDDLALGARDPVQTDGSGAAVEPRHGPDALAELLEPLAPILDPLVAMPLDPNQVRAPDGTQVLPELLTEPGGLIATIEPPAIGIGIGGTFDAQGAAMRAAGQDPHSAERLRFLEETEALRDRLTDAHAARERAAGLRRLQARVRRIWADRSQSAEHRRRAIFDLWDECSDDDVGRVARERIERFVREHLPEGSPDAYPQAELDQLSAERESAAEFAPYDR